MQEYQYRVVEAELLASSPERVFDWLATQSSQPRSTQADLNGDCEAALLGRHEPLIDLALAKFCRTDAAARILFERSTTDDSKHHQALRLSLLGNQAMRGYESFVNLPSCLFDHRDSGLPSWLGRASDDEIHALFSNPTSGQSFLRDFLECKAPWEAMDERRRLVAVYALSSNPRMMSRYRGDMDGYAEYTFNSVSHAAWRLSKTLPPTREWADALGSLLQNQSNESHEMDDSLQIAERWRPAADDEASIESEAKFEKNGHLWGYPLVRQSLARLAVMKNTKLNAELLGSVDQAFRAAVYEHGQMTAEQIMAAYDCDKNLAVNGCQKNLRLWRHADVRKAVHDISWEACSFNDSYMDSANAFNDKEAEVRSSHPDWFSDEEEQVEESSMPATKADLDAAAEDFLRHSNSTHAQLMQAGQSMHKIYERIGWVLWVSIVALAATLWHRL